MRSTTQPLTPFFLSVVLAAPAASGDFQPAPATAGMPDAASATQSCPSPGDTLDLLRNAAVSSTDPVMPALSTLFGVCSDPTLSPILDREVQQFASGGSFPHDASDLDPSLPLVFYQLTSPTQVLKSVRASGKVVVSFEAGGSSAPVLPPPGAGARIGGARSGLLLRHDGTVWTWGADFNFRLGQGNPVAMDQYLPVQVHGPGNAGFLSSIKAVAAGEPFSVALAADGTVWTWGDNGIFGELGIGATVLASSNVPVEVVDTTGPGSCLSSIVAVGARGYHAVALASDGAVYGWGRNQDGECGSNSTVNPQPTPVRVPSFGASPVLAVDGGFQFSLALETDGTVWAWGANNHGQMGDGTSVTPRLLPQRVGQAVGLDGVTQVSAGWKHALALRSDGTVWAWGQNGYGEIGDGTLTDASTPLQVKGPGGVGFLSSIVMVSGGDCHSAALRSDGTVWTWGCNHHNGFNPPPAGVDPVGQLGNGDGSYMDQPYPVQVVGGEQGGAFLGSIVMIAARDYHNFALASDGTLYSWGSNLNGQLGNGSCCLPSTVPVKVLLP